ncbi:MAG: hypothetical protein J6C88_08175 [Lachnospiraceae bacterium]|nr:hypothetical protein [Lachnospiraceae bacterium]
MDTDAETFVSGECPTPSRQARCGQRRNAWEHALLTLTYMNDFQEEE